MRAAMDPPGRNWGRPLDGEDDVPPKGLTRRLGESARLLWPSDKAMSLSGLFL